MLAAPVHSSRGTAWTGRWALITSRRRGKGERGGGGGGEGEGEGREGEGRERGGEAVQTHPLLVSEAITPTARPTLKLITYNSVRGTASRTALRSS